MEDCVVCGGPAPTSPDDSSHDDCEDAWKAETAKAMDEKLAKALETAVFHDSWMEAAYEDQFAL